MWAAAQSEEIGSQLARGLPDLRDELQVTFEREVQNLLEVGDADEMAYRVSGNSVASRPPEENGENRLCHRKR
jgi:hypothetical protein